MSAFLAGNHLARAGGSRPQPLGAARANNLFERISLDEWVEHQGGLPAVV